MSTTQSRAKTTETTSKTAPTAIPPGQKRVRTVTTEETLKPIEAAQPAIKVEILTPHEALIERLRQNGNIEEYTITIFQLNSLDGRTDTRAPGRKFKATIKWDVDNYEEQVQNMFGAGSYLLEVKKNKKLIGICIPFECDNPIGGPPSAAAAPANALYPVVNPIEQMEMQFMLLERLAKIFRGQPTMPTAPMPQVIQHAPAPPPSPVESLMLAASNPNPNVQRIGKLLFGAEESGAVEGGSNFYDFLQALPWATILPTLLGAISVPAPTWSPAQPGQPANVAAQTLPPAQPGQPANVAAPTTPPMTPNIVVQYFVTDLANNAPVERVHAALGQLMREQPAMGSQVAGLLTLPAQQVFDQVAGMVPALNQYRGAPHVLPWIENLKAALQGRQPAQPATEAPDQPTTETPNQEATEATAPE